MKYAVNQRRISNFAKIVNFVGQPLQYKPNIYTSFSRLANKKPLLLIKKIKERLCIDIHFYMKLASIRRPEAGITLRSFSQLIHDLLRGKWQLLPRPVTRCHLNRCGQNLIPAPASCVVFHASVCPIGHVGLYERTYN